MEKEDIIGQLDRLGLEELKVLREHAKKKISRIRQKNRTVFTVYIPAEYKEDVERAVQWAHKEGLIKHPTKWSFCKLAITNLVDIISKKILEERIERIKEETESGAGNNTLEEPSLARDVQGQ